MEIVYVQGLIVDGSISMDSSVDKVNLDRPRRILNQMAFKRRWNVYEFHPTKPNRRNDTSRYRQTRSLRRQEHPHSRRLITVTMHTQEKLITSQTPLDLVYHALSHSTHNTLIMNMST